MRVQRVRFAVLALVVCFAGSLDAQSTSSGNPSQAPAQGQPASSAQVLAQNQGVVKISLDDAIQMALEHNHSLLAARTTIQQNEAQEITANLRPNPVFLGDALFLPAFQPSQFSSDFLDASAQFDLGVSYLFERGKKRQRRLQASKDLTGVTRSEVTDNERGLTFSVASQYINV